MFLVVQKPSLKILIYTLLLLLGLVVTFVAVQKQQRQQAKASVAENVSKLNDYISSEFARYSGITQFLSASPLVKSSLQQPQESVSVDRYLADIQQASGASDAYLLDAQGNVTASSNWRSAHSYKGSNFTFRPYHYLAMQGQASSTFALGLRSQTRGIYFSRGVKVAGEYLGVIVLKVNAVKFESDKARLDTSNANQFMMLDYNNVILLASKPDWQLKSLAPLSEEQQTAIMDSRQFLAKPITSLNFSQGDQAHSAQLAGQHYIFATKKNADSPYTLLMLKRFNVINGDLFLALGAAFLFWLLLVGLGEYTLAKQAGFRQLLFSQRSLEQQVKERSQALEQAQDALIRTAKLATIGQLSASVNHEINQPLSAMSAYIASSKRLLQRGEFEQLQNNLGLIDGLIVRVNRIAGQLKSFSQNQPSKMRDTALTQSVQNALLVVGPEFKLHAVEVSLSLANEIVWVEPFKFEQVLVNLFSNACQAMSNQDVKQLRVQANSEDGKVFISIIDNGTGIKHHALSNIFEPFYTTKSEHGLGLGLSISKQIIDSFQGQLSAHNHPQGGAEFLISLHIKEPEHAK